MRRQSQVTPCPGGGETSTLHRRAHRVSFASEMRDADHTCQTSDGSQERTETITFTTELPRTLIDVKPRRRASAMGMRRRQTGFNPGLDIWTELEEDEQQQQNRQGTATRTFKGRTSVYGSALAQGQSRISTLADQNCRRASALQRPPYASVSGKDSSIGAQEGGEQNVYSHAQPSGVVLREPKRSRRLSTILQTRSEEVGIERTASNEMVDAAMTKQRPRDSALYKNPRRRTIFIPSDDTTMLTIHPGQYHILKADGGRGYLDDTIALSLAGRSGATNAARSDQESIARGSRKSLAAQPKRIPLQPSSRGEVNTTHLEDIPGSGPGKENLPPSASHSGPTYEYSKPNKGPADIVFHFDDNMPLTKSHHQPNLERVSVARRHSMMIKGQGLPKKRSGSISLNSTERKRNSILGSHADSQGSVQARPRQSMIRRLPTVTEPSESRLQTLGDLKLSSLKQSSTTTGRLPLYYPVIKEDLADPEMYEDHWLQRQEIALAQLLNVLLEPPNATLESWKDFDSTLRRQILSLYQGTEFVLAHKRIKASLEFGALAIPREMVAQVSRLSNDIGLRRRFVDMWLESYDLEVLRVALEVVTGREVVLPSRMSDSAGDGARTDTNGKMLSRGLERFIEAFLVRNEDSQQLPTSSLASISGIAREVGSQQPSRHLQTWLWRRTMLRSLMLILLLDRVKTSGSVRRCLFQRESPRKSSTAVIQTLASMLFPSLGDVARPLAHLDYRVAHVQFPLEEYEYKVDNLAVDLRDGIILARVVEILSSRSRSKDRHADQSTVTTPPSSDDVLNTVRPAKSTEAWAISQQLKLPCVSRVQRLYNVQLSLDAVQNELSCIGLATDDVTAEDVVDGHREKTLSMLWNLMVSCGLDWLVDGKALISETTFSRKQRELPIPGNGTHTAERPQAVTGNRGEEHDIEQLLFSWARSIALKHDFWIENMTTSFADGKAFEVIIDEYTPFLPASKDKLDASASISAAASKTTSVPDKLSRLGCSSSFVSLFTQTSASTTPIPSKSFVVSTLAYLASRLVPHASAHRAAVRLQRWYRRHLERGNVVRRLRLMRVAAECAMVVRTRTRVVGAACVLQRAWRDVLQRRLDRLVGDVIPVQALVRGWRCRLGMHGDQRRRRAYGW